MRDRSACGGSEGAGSVVLFKNLCMCVWTYVLAVYISKGDNIIKNWKIFYKSGTTLQKK